MRWCATLAVLLTAPAIAGESANPEPVHEEPWTLGASLFWYLAPGSKNFWVLNASADHGPIHLELRYHDEAIGTASALIGWNIELGDRLRLGLTPSVGCLVGDQGGPIFGLDVALSWGPLSFSAQHEWLWVVQGGNGWFFYDWTELDVRPWPWVRAGIVTERTRLFHTAREWIFGPLVRFTVWKVDLSVYWFQPGGIDQTFAAKLAWTF
jgi:hypothetical protein